MKTVVAEEAGIVKFLYFMGGYWAIWKDTDGEEQIFELYFSQDEEIEIK
jgi:hypothetical protein